MSNNRFLPSLNRGNTEAGDMTGNRRGSYQGVCQRCKRFEADLTDTTDNLSATDTELKASRQVISLLQRQLELFQVEKEGLEKLIVSQSKNNLALDNHETSLGGSEFDLKLEVTKSGGNEMIEGDLLGGDTGSKLSASEGGSCSPDHIQKRLLSLIKTQLYTKDEEIVKLKSSLKEVQNEREQLNLQVHNLEDDVTKLKAESTLLRENLSLRDQTIVSLSNELFEQSGGYPNSTHDQRRQSSAETLISGHYARHQHQNSSHQARQIHKLSDTLEAYKKTNELLSQNVLKLTDKCNNLERREMESKSQAQELEARCCQIQSKLLSLLKEIESSTTKQHPADGDSDETKTSQKSESNEFIQSEPVKLLIKRLLEDKSLDIPLSWKQGNSRSRIKKVQRDDESKLECDELGFYIATSDDKNEGSPTGQSSPMNLRAQRSRVLRRGMSEGGAYLTSRLNSVSEAHEVSEDNQLPSVDSNRSEETRWRLSWDEFIKDFDKINLVKSKEFKELLRWGVPQEYRCKIWKALIDLKVGKERQSCGPDYYQSLLEPPSAKGATHNQLASKQHNSMNNPSSKQIELDLLRTLPNNKYFETIDSPGTIRLRRVLLAFAAHKPDVGYCQGMNRLAAVALLVLPEEEAFWCLVAIIEKIMPTGYYNDLWLAQVDSNVVMDFVGVLMPDLADHFRRHEIELSLFAWFLTIFVDGTPPALFLRLWDCFLFEGDKIMFRVALALVKMHEKELLKLDSSVAVNSFLRSIVNKPMDIDHFFIKIAFESINPLPGRALRARRENHFQAMRSNIKSFVGTSKTGALAPCDNRTIKNDEVERDCEPQNEDSSIISI